MEWLTIFKWLYFW